MRAKDIQTGGEYFTKVSGERVQVRVIQDNGGRGRRYLVARVDNGKLLQSRRAAAALHPSGGGYWPGAMERQETMKANRGRQRCNPEEGIRSYGPGKFSNVIDGYVYAIMMDGFADEELGEAETFGHYALVRLGDKDSLEFVEREVREQGDELTAEERDLIHDSAGVVFYTRSDGIVEASYFDTKSELDKAWSDLEAEYEEWPEEYGEEDEDY